MGRHSVPEDDGDLLVAPVEPDPNRPRPLPRHAAPDAQADLDTDVIVPELVAPAPDQPSRNVVDAVVIEDEPYPPRTEPADEFAPARPSPAAKRERPGRADLRLLRHSSALRARCAGAVLVPFILYTITLIVISRLDAYVIWIWIPAIVGGVLFGAQLDAAHRAATPTE